MKKYSKKILSIALTMVMLLSAAPLSGFIGLKSSNFSLKAEAATQYIAGAALEFGSYPQSKVTDSKTLSELNALSLSWVSYNYYRGNGHYGSATASDYMRYSDIYYNGEKYRAVTFDTYRTYDTNAASGTYQYDNGYYCNKIYWFKFEPITWRVLDPSTGCLLSQAILDSQAYINTVYAYGDHPEGFESFAYWNSTDYTNYASEYATSSIRAWLNDDFYNTAFTDSEKALICKSEQINKGNVSIYDSETTNDYVFILSCDEVLKSEYGFSTSRDEHFSRQAEGSDYAKSQGLTKERTGYPNEGKSSWWLRTPIDCRGANVAVESGQIFGHTVNSTSIGVRPAIKVNLSAEEFEYVIASMETDLSDYYAKGMNDYTFTVKDKADKMRITGPNGSTATYDRNHPRVKIETESDACEKWTISFSANEGKYTAQIKRGGKWESPGLMFEVNFAQVEKSKTNITAKVNGTEQEPGKTLSIKKGQAAIITVIAPENTQKIQLVFATGSTGTYTPANATVENNGDGTCTWTVKRVFSGIGTGSISLKLKDNSSWYSADTQPITLEVTK